MWSPISPTQLIWCWAKPNNPVMELTEEQFEELETALEKLESLDPASLPEPAADLASLLGRILDEMESQ